MQLRQAGLTWHVVGDDVVVLDLKGSVYLKLNGSARVLWERLAEPCTEAELAATLVERFGIDDEQAASDVAAFLGRSPRPRPARGVSRRDTDALGRATAELRRLLRTPPRDLLTAVHVVVVIAAVELLIRWVPLPRLSALLGVRLNLAPVEAPAEQLPRRRAVAARPAPVALHAPRRRRRGPSAPGPCLRRSLVVGHLLRDQHPALRLGVAGTGDDAARPRLGRDRRPTARGRRPATGCSSAPADAGR